MPLAPAGSGRPDQDEEARALITTQDNEEIIERVAALVRWRLLAAAMPAAAAA